MGDVMNLAGGCDTHAPADPLVYRVEFRSAGWPRSLVFHGLTFVRFHMDRSVVLSANVTFEPIMPGDCTV